MSQPPISLSDQIIDQSPDLKALRDQGFEIEVIDGSVLLMHRVPYVNHAGNIASGTLVSSINLAGTRAARPSSHQTWFIGEHPCGTDGAEIQGIKHGNGKKDWGGGIISDISFSAKPHHGEGYGNYEEKMGTYYRIISGPAEQLDGAVNSHLYDSPQIDEREYPFMYPDTATTRAGIKPMNDRLALSNVAIIGLGGSGSYILDLVAKTPVSKIHIIDGDEFINHNAFRSPGAVDIETLEEKPKKVEYYHALYSKLHTGIIPYGLRIDAGNLAILAEMDFVFIAIDDNPSRKVIVDFLYQNSIAFLDVGIGIRSSGDKLGGLLRITTGTQDTMELAYQKLPFGRNDEYNEYNQNIQVADLNALNACLAVIRWKKMFGFYHDYENEGHSLYTIDGNKIDNE